MTIRYHDVSHFNGAYQPTGPTVAKATEGATFTDPEFAGIRSRTRAGGWPFLAYHFLAHGNIAAQVSHVVSVIGRGQPLMLDVESEPGTPDPTLADVLAFADQYAAAGGRVTLGYLPHWYWSGHLGSPSLAGLRSRHIGLVASLFSTYSDSGAGWAAYGGLTPVVWQYTSMPLDTNAFKGTQTQLADLWANGSPHVEVPEVELTDKLSNGITVNEALVTIFNRSANLGPWERQELDSIVKTLAALPAAVVAALPTVGQGAFTPEQIAQIQTAMSAALANIQVSVTTSPTVPTTPTTDAQ